MWNNFDIGIDEISFNGIKFRINNPCSKEYYDELIEEGTPYSKAKYLEMFNNEFLESIHIKLSFHYLFLFLALVFLSIGIILSFQKYLIEAVVVFALSGIGWFIGWLYLRSARKEKKAMAMNKSFIDLVFDQRRMELEEAKSQISSKL